MTTEPRQRLTELPALVLGPLRGLPDRTWVQSPPGKWTPAQIVEHLALGLNLSAASFLSRRAHAAMSRRRRSPAEHVARLFIFGLRWFPPGRKAPQRTVPSPQIDGATAEAHFLDGIEMWDQVDRALLPERHANLFVKHPRMGDLTVEEWMRFHVIHARHHAKQIRERIGQ